MTHEEQLQSWLKGNSQHMGDKGTGQCCPDFSCCRPELLAPIEERQAFVLADERGRMPWLGTFLGRAFAGKRVHIAGATEHES